jgi:hypothetical protein
MFVLHRRLGALVAVVLIASAGCAGDQESLIVTHAPAWPSNGECVVEAGQSAGMLGGTLDLEFATPYLMPAVLLNQLQTQQGATRSTGIDNSEVQLRSVDVELELPQAPELIEGLREVDDALVEFRVPLATVSIPGGARHGVAVEVVPRPTAIVLGEDLARFQPSTPSAPGASAVLRLLANVTFNASYTSGRAGMIASREFSFPIDICVGCMIDCSGCPNRVCPAEPIWTGFICGNAQDAFMVPLQCTDEWVEDPPE